MLAVFHIDLYFEFTMAAASIIWRILLLNISILFLWRPTSAVAI